MTELKGIIVFCLLPYFFCGFFFELNRQWDNLRRYRRNKEGMLWLLTFIQIFLIMICSAVYWPFVGLSEYDERPPQHQLYPFGG